MLTDSPVDARSLGAILLAAGASKRLGQPKQLLDIQGEPLVVRQARLLEKQGYASVIVVTGAHSEEVAELLCPLAVRCVHNPDWEEGMGKSLARGIQAMPERARASLILLCDQWKVATEHLETLHSAWFEEPQSAVVSEFDDTMGPPAILPRSLFEKLSRLKGDAGANKVLRRWHGNIIQMPNPDAGIDIDTSDQIPA